MDDLADYIDQARHRGYEDDEIRDSLVGGGWDAAQVDAKLSELAPPELPTHVSASPSLPAENAPYLQPENYAAATQQAQADDQAQQTPASVVTVTTPELLPMAGQPVAGQPQPFTDVSEPASNHSHLKVLLVVVVVVVTAYFAYSLFAPKTKYQTVVDKFIVAVQKGDRSTVDALESPASKEFYQKTTGSSGFYAACQDAGELCTFSFQPAFINKATKTLRDYKAVNGKAGKEVVYTIAETTNTDDCKSTSTSKLSIAVVPKGRSWQVDSVGQNVDFSSRGCIGPGQ